MNIIGIQTGDYLVNTYICHNEQSKETVIVDPGGSYNKILNVINDYQLLPKAVLLTHGHFDHIGALNQLCEDFDVTVYIHKDDADMLTDANKNLSAFLFAKPIQCKVADKLMGDKQHLVICGIDFDLVHTPGHSPGSCVFMTKNVAFTGDTLFNRSIGRTDFLGCDAAKMNESLVKLKKIIPAEYKILPGHGTESTMADELQNNIYLNQ